MSHLKERKEKNCLNCNTAIIGRYCHICGQENIEPRESAWHLITHFFQDITHFDGKFFSTLKLVVARPGFLSAEYAKGKRARYLNPVRMYIFTSAFFFLVFFTLYKTSKETIIANSTVNGKTMLEINQMDSLSFAAFSSNINEADGKAALPMTREDFRKYYDSAVNKALSNPGGAIQFSPTTYSSRHEYDSMLNAGGIDDNWLERKLNYKGIEMQEKYKGNNQEAFASLVEVFFHKLPQLLFVSLPILAFLLKLLYTRRKEFYYVSHGIFSLHFYIFVFIVMLVSLLIGKANNSLGWGFLTIVRVVLMFSVFFYLYKAMHNFYQQGWLKTLFKFLILSFAFLAIMIVLFAIFLLLSFFSV